MLFGFYHYGVQILRSLLGEFFSFFFYGTLFVKTQPKFLVRDETHLVQCRAVCAAQMGRKNEGRQLNPTFQTFSLCKMEMGLGVWSIQERKQDGKKDQQKIFQFVKINLRPSLITTSDHLLSLDQFIFMVSGNPFLKDPCSFFLSYQPLWIIFFRWKYIQAM